MQDDIAPDETVEASGEVVTPSRIVTAIDVSSNQTLATASNAITLLGPDHVIAKLYLPIENAPQQNTLDHWAQAKDMGCTLGGYVWCYADVDPRQTVQWALELASRASVVLPVLWLDCETYGGKGPNYAWLATAIDEAHQQSQVIGIYTGAWYWNDYVTTHAFGDLPLWTANYNGTPDLNVPLYGGWQFASGHQWTDVPVDQSVFLEEVTIAPVA